MNCKGSSFLSLLAEKVTEIKTNIFVTSFGPVSDTEMVRISLHLHTMFTYHSFSADEACLSQINLCLSQFIESLNLQSVVTLPSLRLGIVSFYVNH